jgi:hypothetical protein
MVTLAPMLVPELSHAFTTAFPATQIRHLEGNQEQLIQGLRRSEVDVAITYDLQIPEDILFTALVDLPPHVLVGEAHPFAQRSAVSLPDLVAEPMILLDLPLSREYFMALFMKAGLQPFITARSAHQEVVRTMVANGYGYYGLQRPAALEPGSRRKDSDARSALRRSSSDADRDGDAQAAEHLALGRGIPDALQDLHLGFLHSRHGGPRAGAARPTLLIATDVRASAGRPS